MEVAASECTDKHNGVIDVVWLKGSSIFDYEPAIYDRMLEYCQKYWPIRAIGAHSCCPSGILLQFIVPILNDIADRWFRSRSIIHAVPEDQIVDALSAYGIRRDMLPTEMELNTDEWIAHRRAVEMEKI